MVDVHHVSAGFELDAVIAVVVQADSIEQLIVSAVVYQHLACGIDLWRGRYRRGLLYRCDRADADLPPRSLHLSPYGQRRK